MNKKDTATFLSQSLLGRPQCFLSRQMQQAIEVITLPREPQQQQRRSCSRAIAQQQEQQQQM